MTKEIIVDYNTSASLIADGTIKLYDENYDHVTYLTKQDLLDMLKLFEEQERGE